MTKFAVVAAVAIAGMVVNSENAFAGRRCCRTRQSACCCAVQPTCCNSGCNTGCNSAAPVYNNNMAPATPAPPVETPTAQAGGYQSYSYEPGTAPVAQPAVVVGTPQAYRNSVATFPQFRGDRKALGNY